MNRSMRFARLSLLVLSLLVFLASSLVAQETTGGLQGTIKDPSGAVVPRAHVVVTGTSLLGSKEVVTDTSGYYRFANLPPGTYALTVTAEGFNTLKRGGLDLQIGHLPTVNLALAIGTVKTIVEVSTEAPLIDTTTVTTLTNIPTEEIQNVPHGTSFQSVIQFAPSARNEPLAGSTMISNGTGSVSPGNGSNGGSVGYSIGGGSDSENSYLVEGQETANIIGGYSHTNVPFDFIEEVQLKSSGIEAEHGGALGGVVNVIMKKGTSQWHGSLFTQFQDGGMNGSPNPYARYDVNSSGTVTSWGAIDPPYQSYQPTRPHTSDFWPGFTIGGPLVGLLPKALADPLSNRLKDRISMFAAFNPEFNAYEETVKFNKGGPTPLSRNTHTFYTYGRVDAEVTQKIRVFASYLYQGERQAGESLPLADSVQGLTNPSAGNSPSNYAHTIGFTAPNITLNTGADITLTQSLVSTSRFGYYFENYHDFGYPQSGTINSFQDSGTGNTDTQGNPISGSLAVTAGFSNLPIDSSFTHRNANKAIQFDQDLAWFHSGRGGTHNVKFGYQLNRNSNDILQGFNTVYTQVWPGVTNPYAPQGPTGKSNCAAVEAANLANNPSAAYKKNPTCVGQYGTIDVYDFGSGGRAIAYNHAFFVQDAWTVAKGLTVNFGLRLENEYLPAENQPSNAKITKPIDFGWGGKIAPRIGAAWDVFHNNKMKIFGGYGNFYDQMKLNVAISSYGGQYWQECWYALNTPSLAGINPVFNSNGRDCVGFDATSQANFGGTTPPGLVFLENQNLRAWPTTCSTCSIAQEGTAPGLKPYEQHESDFGVDYQIKPNVAFEARWDRRRLDHVIEDSSIFNPDVGEVFVIVNPGQGVNSTFNGFYNFIYGTPPPPCTGVCPATGTIPAARSYDGFEFRMTKGNVGHWAGMFSYTYSYFRGNYTGLTSTDVADGGGGRNAPNNSRSFDEPHFSWNANGGSSSGLLPTDRPNALKGQAYYELQWLRKLTTDFGIFQIAYSGSPLTSYLDVGYAFPSGNAPPNPPSGAFPVDIVNRGKWVDVTQNVGTGLFTVSAPYTKRTPWYTQSDLNIRQAVKIGESKSISFDATFSNVLNQHNVVSNDQEIDSGFATNFVGAAGHTLFDGPAFYGAAEHKYDYVAAMNSTPVDSGSGGNGGGGPITLSSQYGKPYLYQVGRNIRLGMHITF